MLSARLVRMIEDHAEDITREVLKDLASNPHTPTYHKLSQDELHRRAYGVYHNLGKWLADKSEASVEATYSALGRTRMAEGVPLSEVIYALILEKEHLRRYIRSAGLVDSAVDLHREGELNLLVGHFFDNAVFFTAKGHETGALKR